MLQSLRKLQFLKMLAYNKSADRVQSWGACWYLWQRYDERVLEWHRSTLYDDIRSSVVDNWPLRVIRRRCRYNDTKCDIEELSVGTGHVTEVLGRSQEIVLVTDKIITSVVYLHHVSIKYKIMKYR